MSEFNNKSITTKGMELLSKALAGSTLEFTKIQLGNGRYEGNVGIAEALVSPMQTLDITKISRKEGEVTLSTTLRLEDITTGFEWTEIGIYAKVGTEEVLYMYGYTENSSYISKDSLNEKLINITVLVSNAAQVTAKIDDSLVYLTAEALSDHDANVAAHQDIRKQVEDAVKETKEKLDVALTNYVTMADVERIIAQSLGGLKETYYVPSDTVREECGTYSTNNNTYTKLAGFRATRDGIINFKVNVSTVGTLPYVVYLLGLGANMSNQGFNSSVRSSTISLTEIYNKKNGENISLTGMPYAAITQSNEAKEYVYGIRVQKGDIVALIGRGGMFTTAICYDEEEKE